MSVRPTFDKIVDWLAAKPGGHFTIERWGNGLAVTIQRTGCPPETIIAKTPGEANRLRLALSDAGLVGMAKGLG